MNHKIDDKIIMGGNNLQEIQNYVNFSHVVHMYMRGHKVGVSTFGIGVLTDNSVKQKMNSRSSNESEVIVNSEYLPYNIWYEKLLESKGYPMK